MNKKYLSKILFSSVLIACFLSGSAFMIAGRKSNIAQFYETEEVAAGKKNNTEKIITRKVSLRDDVMTLTNITRADIEYVNGPASMEIRGPEKEVNNLVITTDNNELYIMNPRASEPNNNQFNSKLTIRISARNISQITLKGSGNLTGENISGVIVGLYSFGSGDISIKNVDATSLEVYSLGSGDILIQSVGATSFSANTKGSGDIVVKALNTTTLDAMTFGSGDIVMSNIHATEITGMSFGSGDLTLSGSTTSLNTSCRGSGDINTTRLKINR